MLPDDSQVYPARDFFPVILWRSQFIIPCMGGPACYLRFCPNCDAEVAPDTDICSDCSESLSSFTDE